MNEFDYERLAHLEMSNLHTDPRDRTAPDSEHLNSSDK